MNIKDKNSTKKTPSDIPKQIFEKFLEELKSTEIPVEITNRLGDILIKKEILSDTDIKNALFSDIPKI
jgi:CxxC motif-containing protein